jgi:hypothetical protein
MLSMLKKKRRRKRKRKRSKRKRKKLDQTQLMPLLQLLRPNSITKKNLQNKKQPLKSKELRQNSKLK